MTLTGSLPRFSRERFLACSIKTRRIASASSTKEVSAALPLRLALNEPEIGLVDESGRL